MNHDSLVEIAPHDGLHVDLAYATDNTPINVPVYRPDARAAMRPEAAACLYRAADAATRCGLTLLIWDTYRPAAVQQRFWDAIQDARYIANPANGGSNHTRGVAVDLTLRDADGTLLDMGTGFDDLRELSHHDRNDLSPIVQRHRSLLLGIMLHAGFAALPTEWWHYELPDAKRFDLIPESPLVRMLAEHDMAQSTTA